MHESQVESQKFDPKKELEADPKDESNEDPDSDEKMQDTHQAP